MLLIFHKKTDSRSCTPFIPTCQVEPVVVLNLGIEVNLQPFIITAVIALLLRETPHVSFTYYNLIPLCSNTAAQ